MWVLFAIGGGAYVVIDKRAKVSNDDHDTLSDDGNGIDEHIS